MQSKKFCIKLLFAPTPGKQSFPGFAPSAKKNTSTEVGCFSFRSGAPPVGFEPTTNRLTVDSSTAELQGNGFWMVCGSAFAMKGFGETQETISFLTGVFNPFGASMEYSQVAFGDDFALWGRVIPEVKMEPAIARRRLGGGFRIARGVIGRDPGTGLDGRRGKPLAVGDTGDGEPHKHNQHYYCQNLVHKAILQCFFIITQG